MSGTEESLATISFIRFLRSFCWYNYTLGCSFLVLPRNYLINYLIYEKLLFFIYGYVIISYYSNSSSFTRLPKNDSYKV